MSHARAIAYSPFCFARRARQAAHALRWFPHPPARVYRSPVRGHFTSMCVLAIILANPCLRPLVHFQGVGFLGLWSPVWDHLCASFARPPFGTGDSGRPMVTSVTPRGTGIVNAV